MYFLSTPVSLPLQQYAENKSFCEDLTEGKFSFPIIHAIRSNPESHQLTRILPALKM